MAIRKNIPTAQSQSLVQRKGLRDKVLRIYFDHPCGNKFNSNFHLSTPDLNFKYMWATPLLKVKKYMNYLIST
jgi:hypothetical protein